MTEIENLYSVLGGRFITPPDEMKAKLQKIKAFVFDWDGVFNNGEKSASQGSTFSEVDSMGCNLLRYSYFIKHGMLPLSALISGEKNETAFHFCQREGFTHCYFKVPHKLQAFAAFCEKESLGPEQVAYFFDDVLDIPVAEACGLRIMVNQGVNPLFLQYCLKRNLVDYLSASRGGQFAVREGTELLIGLNDNYTEVIEGRKNNAKHYQDYISERRRTITGFYTLNNEAIQQTQV